MSKRGFLIAVEGCDRLGKTTQCLNLVNKLRFEGFDVKYQKYPDLTTKIGCLIKEHLENKTKFDDRVIHLLFSTNRWELNSKIESLIEKGISVVLDRYFYSGIVYSKILRNINENWSLNIEIGLLLPDIVFLFHIDDIEKIRNRFDKQNFYENDLEQQKKIQKEFFKMSQKYDENWFIVDISKKNITKIMYEKIMYEQTKRK